MTDQMKSMTRDELLRAASDVALGDRPRRALAMLERYLKKSKTPDIEVLLLRGFTLEILGEDAIPTYRAVLNLEPNNADALIGMGDGYLAESKYSRALMYYRRARQLSARRRQSLKVKDDFVVALMRIAFTLNRLNRHAEASRSLRRGRLRYPSDVRLTD